MKVRHFFAPLTAAAGLFLTSCAETPDIPSRQRPYVPRVSIPAAAETNEYERRYLPEVEDVLSAAGYRCVTGGPAEYRLEFSVEAGPVNADTALVLYRGESEIARSQARKGSALALVQRRRVIDESFQKCLDDFESRIPRGGGGGGGYYDGGGRPEAPADWQTGWQQ